MKTNLLIICAITLVAVDIHSQTAPASGGANPAGGTPGAVPARPPGTAPVGRGTLQQRVPAPRESRTQTLPQNPAGSANNANAGATNSALGTNGLGVSNSTTVSNTVGFNTNLLGVFSNRGIVIISSNASPEILVRGVAASTNRGARGSMNTNTETSHGVTTDIAVTPEDQAIVASVRRVLSPQSIARGTSSKQTPIHLVVQNGVVTLLGTVSSVDEKRRIETLVQRIPGVTRVVDQLGVMNPTLADTPGMPAQPGLLNTQPSLTPTGRPFSNGVPVILVPDTNVPATNGTNVSSSNAGGITITNSTSVNATITNSAIPPSPTP